MKNIPVWVYWEGNNIPPFIKLSMKTIEKNIGYGFSLNILNENTVKEYIPYLNTDKINGIRHKIKDDDPKHIIPMKADYIRSRLLLTYGGVWVDADTIVVKPFSSLIPLLEKHSYVGRKQESGFVSVGFMACKPGCSLMDHFCSRQDDLLEISNVLPGSGLGSRLLTPIVKNWNQKSVYLLDREVAPISFKNRRIYFHTDLYRIHPSVIMFMLYNKGFPDWFRTMKKDDILEGPWIISQIFREALK